MKLGGIISCILSMKKLTVSEVRWFTCGHREEATIRSPGKEGVNFREEKDPPLAVCTPSSSPFPSAWKYLVGLNRIFSFVLWGFALWFPLPALPFTALLRWWNLSFLLEASSNVLVLVGPLPPPPPLPVALQAGSSQALVHEVHNSPKPAFPQAVLTGERQTQYFLVSPGPNTGPGTHACWLSAGRKPTFFWAVSTCHSQSLCCSEFTPLNPPLEIMWNLDNNHRNARSFDLSFALLPWELSFFFFSPKGILHFEN